MNISADMKELRELGLKPYQAELVRDMLDSPLPARRLLVSEPGFGKTVAAMSLAREIARANQNYRILVIAPHVFAAMYTHQYARAVPDMIATVVDRRKLREMEAAVKHDQPVWPSAITAVIGMDTARQKDVLDHICSVKWDLVIVEEVHLYGRSRWTLLKTILSNKAFQRVLLMTTTPNVSSIASLLKGVARTCWVTSEINDWDGQPLFARVAPKCHTVMYRRGDDEIAVVRCLSDLGADLAANPKAQLVRRTLLRQATSSMLALEGSVRSLRNSLVHYAPGILDSPSGTNPFDDGSSGIETDVVLDTPNGLSRAEWQNKAHALARLNKLIDLIESVHTDKKRDALRSVIQRIYEKSQPADLKICVLCSFKVTAHYLQTVLSERVGRVGLLTTDRMLKDYGLVLEQFNKEGGVLISTVTALQGIDLRGTKWIIHYDPPSSAAEMHIRLTRSSTAEHYFLKDESGVLPEEPYPDLIAK
jgi:ERCC4-related helicase